MISVRFTPPRGFAQLRETGGARSVLGPAVRITFVCPPASSGAAALGPPSTLPEANQIRYVIFFRSPALSLRVTQTRSWVYDANQRLTSVTHPESGTTSYLYNADGTVQRKTDAKGQKVEFSYDGDGRVTVRRRYVSSGYEDVCGKVSYY